MTTVQITASIMDEVLDFLVSAPTPEQIIAFHPSEGLQEYVSHLLDKNRNGTLTLEESQELDECTRMTHLIRLLKARAHKKLAQS